MNERHGSFGASVGRKWVALYTRRLPAAEAADRRAEIESDLFEHAADASAAHVHPVLHSIDVLGRVLSGVPADLSWRREVLRSRERSIEGVSTNMPQRTPPSQIALIVFASLGIFVGTSILPLAGQWDDDGFFTMTRLWIFGAAGTAALLGVGLALQLRGGRPRTALACLVVGASAPSIGWFWLPPVYLITIGVIVSAMLANRATTTPAVIT